MPKERELHKFECRSGICKYMLLYMIKIKIKCIMLNVWKVNLNHLIDILNGMFGRAPLFQKQTSSCNYLFVYNSHSSSAMSVMDVSQKHWPNLSPCCGITHFLVSLLPRDCRKIR